MLSGIAHLALNVKDMEKSVDFYTCVLGLKKAFELPEPRSGKPWIVYLYLGGRQFVELFYHGVDACPVDHAQGFNHICLEVDDIHQIASQIQTAGCKMDVLPLQGADKNWQAWVTDPDGVKIELMQISPDSPQGRIIAQGKV
ncbi:MAG: VOC family protein [Treponema sp.]|jgi:lactoylglutathione lyase|nr:VOC family protein [Treponema sp.]